MDGNGRWARQRHLPRVAGHRAGRPGDPPGDGSVSPGRVHILTLYAFSTENWQRPRGEVTALMRLFGETIDREVGELHDNGVQIRVLGDRSALSESLQQKVAQAEALTAGDTAAILNVAITTEAGARSSMPSASWPRREPISTRSTSRRSATRSTPAACLTRT